MKNYKESYFGKVSRNMPAFNTSLSHSPPAPCPWRSPAAWGLLSPGNLVLVLLVPVKGPVQRLPDSDETLVVVTGSQNSYSL